MSDLLAVLAAFQHDPLSPGALGDLVLPFRRQFQLYPDQKVILGAISRFWDTFSAVWDAQTTLLCRGDVTVIPSIQTLAILLATLCQGVALNQRAAMYESPSLSVLRSLETISTSVEPHLSRVLTHSSSLVNLEDDAYKSMIRFCCKALTNLSTTDESSIIDPLAARLQSESSDSVIARLLASSDVDTLQAVLMFVFNLVHASPARSLALSTSKSGSYIIDRMLVLVQAYFDIDELDEDQVELNAPIFNVSYSIVQQLVELDCFPQAYEHQASPALDFKISSSQLILLKFLDGYLSAPSSSPTPLNLASPELTLFLLSTFVSLSTTLLDETRAKDSRDAAVFQGLVLLLHCLVSIGLASDVGGRSAILPVLETICQLIAASNALTPAPARLSDSPTPTPSAATWIEPLAVGQLKLNCVRLLGILAYESTSAQDRIREAGGLTLLLGLCQINDKNPTLREHSLFAIRNILQNNLTNQALVDGMKPQYLVGERGELRDLPPAMR